MKNGSHRGINITVINTTGADIVAGQPVAIGNLFGFAVGNAVAGADVVLVTEGVVSSKAISTDVIAVGDKLNFNAANKELQKASADLDGVAIAVEAKTASAVEVAVKIVTV